MGQYQHVAQFVDGDAAKIIDVVMPPRPSIDVPGAVAVEQDATLADHAVPGPGHGDRQLFLAPPVPADRVGKSDPVLSIEILGGNRMALLRSILNDLTVS